MAPLKFSGPHSLWYTTSLSSLWHLLLLLSPHMAPLNCSAPHYETPNLFRGFWALSLWPLLFCHLECLFTSSRKCSVPHHERHIFMCGIFGPKFLTPHFVTSHGPPTSFWHVYRDFRAQSLWHPLLEFVTWSVTSHGPPDYSAPHSETKCAGIFSGPKSFGTSSYVCHLECHVTWAPR
jgi:hypothetical protein